MGTDLLIYRRVEFDGLIYVRYIGETAFNTIYYQLLRDGIVVEQTDPTPSDATARFLKQPIGRYQARAILTGNNHQQTTKESIEIKITRTGPISSEPLSVEKINLKGGHRLYSAVKDHYLEVKFKPGGLNALKNQHNTLLAIYEKNQTYTRLRTCLFARRHPQIPAR